MKKIITSLCLFLISYSITTSAQENVSALAVPEKLYIKEHWISLTTTYDIETKENKLGTLYRRFFSFLLTYDFYDPHKNLIAYARQNLFSWTAHFDIYDAADNFIGAANEKIFSFFPTFDIYAADGNTKVATAAMNFWGTKFTLYDPISYREIAVMKRPFFRLKNNWTFKITNPVLFLHKEIEPRVLMTVLAFQGDREYWEQLANSKRFKDLQRDDKQNTSPLMDISSRQLKVELFKINQQIKQLGFDSLDATDEVTLTSVANELEELYQRLEPQQEYRLPSEDLASHFTDYCLSLIRSEDWSEKKKKTVLFLLKKRFEIALGVGYEGYSNSHLLEDEEGFSLDSV